MDSEQSLPTTGTAGWTIPKALADRFTAAGTHLERYGLTFSTTEINSSFYRAHRSTTYARWAASVPDGFRFSVKLSREITHVRRLQDCTAPIEQFLTETSGLGSKRHVVLVQMPPSLSFEGDRARLFFEDFRARFDGHIACEPRHPSWFESDVDGWLRSLRIARVAADPAIVEKAASPGGWLGLTYYRWHGSPRIYYDGYSDERLINLANAIRNDRAAWCIFDNTAAGSATENAIAFQALCKKLQASDLRVHTDCN